MQGMITLSSGGVGRVEGPAWLPRPFLIDQHSQQEKQTMLMQMRRLWSEEHGQDIAEYAVMLAVILVIVVGTIQLIGSNANNVFSGVSSALQ